MKKRFINILISITLAVSQLVCLPGTSINAKTNDAALLRDAAVNKDLALRNNENSSAVWSAGDSVDGDFSYKINSGHTCILTKYTGRETSVVIPAQLGGYEVKEIGDRAFEKCREIVSIGIPDSVTAIGKNAFQSCSKLERITIPDSVTKIGSRAFASCKSLENVALPKNITKLEESVFWECGKLTEINIPDGVQEICFGAFYFTNITRIFIPDSVTKVADYAFGLAVEYVSLPEDTDYVEKYSFVHYGGWLLEGIKMEFRPAPDREPSDSEDGANRLTPIGAYYIYGNKFVNLVHTAHSIETSHKPFDLECILSKDSEAEKFELYSGEERVAESKNGYFKDVDPAWFASGKSIYVRVVGKEKTVTVPLLLEVKDKKIPKISKLKLGGDKITFTVDKNVPLLGGADFTVDFPEIPVNAVIEDGKIKIGINIKKDKLYSWNSSEGNTNTTKKKDFKETFEKWKKDLDKNLLKVDYISQDYINYIESPSLPADLPLASKKIDYTVFGYAEGAYSDTLESLSGEIVFAVTAKGTVQKTILVLEVVPVTFNTEASLKGEADGSIKYHVIDDIWSGDLDGTITGSLEPFLGIGAGTWLSVGAYGQGKLDLKMTLLSTAKKSGLDHVYLSGEIGAKGYFAKKEVFREPLLKGKFVVYSREEGDAATGGKSLEKNDTDRADMYRFAWSEDNRSASFSPPGADSKIQAAAIVKNAYGAAEPKMVAVGDKSVIVYLDNDESRALPNQTVLKYVVYDAAAGSMSAPKIVSDDQTADFKPYLYTDGENIYVYYLNSAKKYSENEDPDISDYAGTFSVTIAKYDMDADAFIELGTLNRTNSYCYAPSLASAEDGLVLAWVENAGNQVFAQTQDNSIYYSVYKDGKWSEPQAIAENLNSITSLAAGNLAGSMQIAYCEDMDNDLSTGEQQVFIADLAGNARKVLQNQVSNLQITELPGVENPVLAFNKNGAVSYISSVNSGEQHLFEEGTMDAGSGFQIEGNRIYFLKPSEEGGRNIGCMIHTNSGWGSIDFTSEKDYVDSFSVSGGKLVYLVTAVEMDGNDIDTTSDIKFSESDNKNNLSLDHVAVEEENLKPDSSFPMICTVTNHGTDVVYHPVVTLYDKNSQAVLQQQTLQLSINPGATVQQEVNFTMPAAFENAVYEVGIEEDGKTDSCLEDNYKAVDLSKTELEVSTEYRVIKDGKYIVVKVENSSNVPAVADIVVTKPDGSAILSRDSQAIQANESVELLAAVDDIIPDGADDIILTASAKTTAFEYYQSNNVCEQRIWKMDYAEPVVTENEIKIQNIILSVPDASLNTNHTLQLKAGIVPENATNKNLKWSSDNEQVAKVDQNGFITAVGAGKATITAASLDGSGVSASCVITVTKAQNGNPDHGNLPGDNESGGTPGGSSPGSGSGGSTSGGSSSGSNSGGSSSSGSAGGSNSGNDGLQVNLLYYIANFDANGGTGLSRKTMTLLMDDTLGILPKVNRKNYSFQGWYTQKSGGEKVKQQTILNASATLYARWAKIAKPAKVKNLTLKSAKSGQLEAAFQKVTGAAGYQIVYSANKKFVSSATKKAITVSRKQTFKKLKTGRKYYVKVRAYKTGSMGEKIYGPYSKAKTIRIK